jgi:hypothetical protein
LPKIQQGVQEEGKAAHFLGLVETGFAEKSLNLYYNPPTYFRPDVLVIYFSRTTKSVYLKLLRSSVANIKQFRSRILDG